jgi:hypothetical protein
MSDNMWIGIIFSSHQEIPAAPEQAPVLADLRRQRSF